VATPAGEMAHQVRGEAVARAIVRVEHRLTAGADGLDLLVRVQPVVEELELLRS
jgi:hypothetical protein